jgi:hypothetical protein
MRAINLDPWPLDEGPRPKSGKSRLNVKWHHFGGKINLLLALPTKARILYSDSL